MNKGMSPDGTYNYVDERVKNFPQFWSAAFNETDIIHFFNLDWDITDLVVDLGFMPSKGQARRNGYEGDIATGFEEYIFGKKMNIKKVYTYKPNEKVLRILTRYRGIYG